MNKYGFRLRQFLLAASIPLALSTFPAFAEDGVSATEIRLGMANAQTGPAAGLGTGMKAGASAYFARVNAAGGVNGRKIELVVKDDGYETARTASATEAPATDAASAPSIKNRFVYRIPFPSLSMNWRRRSACGRRSAPVA